jgi:hypothetical protein
MQWARGIDERACRRELDVYRRQRDEARGRAPTKLLGHPLRGVLAATVCQEAALEKLGARAVARGDEEGGRALLEASWARALAGVTLLESPDLSVGALLARLVVARSLDALEDLTAASVSICRQNAVAREASPLNAYMMSVGASAARVLRGEARALERDGKGRMGPYAAVQRAWGRADAMQACLSALLQHHLDDAGRARGQTLGVWALYPVQLFALRDLSTAAGCEVAMPEHELLATPFGALKRSAEGWARADEELVAAVEEARAHVRQAGLRHFL